MKNTENILKSEIKDVEMPTALKNALENNGITKISQIVSMNRFQIKMMRNFGKRRIEMLQEFLTENKLEILGGW